MVNSRQKGNRGEQQVMSLLGRMTEEKWEQTPGSGSGKIKGDLRVPGKHNLFCVEVKFYKDSGFNSRYTHQKQIICLSGGVNYVDKHKIWNKNHCSSLEKIMESFLLQQYKNRKIH